MAEAKKLVPEAKSEDLLLSAVRDGNIEAVRNLLEQENAVDMHNNGKKALLLAAKQGHREIASLLFDKFLTTKTTPEQDKENLADPELMLLVLATKLKTPYDKQDPFPLWYDSVGKNNSGADQNPLSIRELFGVEIKPRSGHRTSRKPKTHSYQEILTSLPMAPGGPSADRPNSLDAAAPEIPAPPSLDNQGAAPASLPDSQPSPAAQQQNSQLPLESTPPSDGQQQEEPSEHAIRL